MTGIGRQRMVVIDCADPKRLATFWHELTGAPIHARLPEWWSLQAPAPDALRIGFQRVPEPKTGKNRVHLDFDVDDLEEATSAAESLGARRSGGIVEEDEGQRFQVMLDPEGNEFCLLVGYP